MSCKLGGDITIHGLFPEDDITSVDVPCDWHIYARPDCLPNTEYVRQPNALWIKNARVEIPIQDIVDMNAEWSISFDYWNKQSAYTVDFYESSAFRFGGPTNEYFEIEYSERDQGVNWFSRVRLNTLNSTTTWGIYQDYGCNVWKTNKQVVNIPAGYWEQFTSNLRNGTSRSSSYTVATATVQGWVPKDWILGGGYRTNNQMQYANLIIEQGGEVLAYWPMDEGSGTLLIDRSGNNRHLSIKDFGDCLWDTQVYVPGRKALQFDGTSTYIEIPWGDISIIGDLNLGFRLTAVPDSARWHPLISKKDTVLGVDADHFYWALESKTGTLTGNSTVEAGTTSSTATLSTAGFNVGLSNRCEIFKSSTPNITSTAWQYPIPNTVITVAQRSHNVGTTNWNNFVSTGTIQIGCNNDRTAFFGGTIRDIVLVPLTGADPIYFEHPLVWYTLDDEVEDGGIIHDRSGNGYHGILHLGGGSWVDAV